MEERQRVPRRRKVGEQSRELRVEVRQLHCNRRGHRLHLGHGHAHGAPWSCAGHRAQPGQPMQHPWWKWGIVLGSGVKVE